MSRLRDGGWILPASLCVALLLGLLPLPETLQPLRPYWLALVLAYWVIEAPDNAGLGLAVIVGLVADLMFGTLLGEQALRLGTRVGHAHARAATGQPLRHREPGFAEPQYQCEFAFVVHQRSLRVDRPTRTRIIVTIQKRTTTLVSFQPFCSKWWCSGAIRNTRRPSP